MDLYLFVGRSMIGKSSAIRALTGVGNATDFTRTVAQRTNMLRIAYTTGIYDTLVLAPALQELKIPPLDFYTTVTNLRVQHAIGALRYHSCRGIVDGQGYINDLNSLSGGGWRIHHILLHSTPLPLTGSKGLHISTIGPSTGLPSNAVAAIARQQWGIS